MSIDGNWADEETRHFSLSVDHDIDRPTLAECVADEAGYVHGLTHMGPCYFTHDHATRCQNGGFKEDHAYTADDGWTCPGGES